MSEIGMSVEAMTGSLTGFDELAISKHFGVSDMSELPGSQAVRALVFIHRKRHGRNDVDAYTEAMSLPLQEVIDSFEPAEVVPDEPVTEAGKDTGLNDYGPSTLPPGVS